MPAPLTMVSRFFQLVEKRQFTEAERELERIKQKIDENEWNQGYLKALNGIFLSVKTNDDQYSFISKINHDDGKTLRQYRKEFLKQVNNRLRGDYDRGFFSAWADYIRILIRMRKQEEKTLMHQSASTSAGKADGNNQTSLEHFVSKAK